MTHSKRLYILSLSLILSLILVIGASFILDHHPKKVAKRTGCIAQQLSSESSGMCVRDVQTMVDYIETAGLSECPFTNGKPLDIDGIYDRTTEQQVESVQAWMNCYNKQEGSTNASIPTNGIVNSLLWSQLCTYAYRFPLQSSSNTSPYRQAAITAGKNADC